MIHTHFWLFPLLVRKPHPVFFAQIGSGQVVRGSCAGVDRENGRASAMLRRFFLQRSLLRGFRESHPTNIKTTPRRGTSNTKPGGLGGWESIHAIPWEDVLRYTCPKMRWWFPIDKTSLGHTSHMHYSRSITSHMHYSRSILLYLYMILHLYSCFIMLMSNSYDNNNDNHKRLYGILCDKWLFGC